MKIPVYNQEGQEVKTIELAPKIFDVCIKPWIIQQAIVSFHAQKRVPIAHTKNRGEVRGGGKKPWRQKGTGRARHGSIRSPLWRGGGITFGPRNTRNFTVSINKKVKRHALLMSLTQKAKQHEIKVLDSLMIPQSKTKLIAQLLKNLNIEHKKVLLALETAANTVLASARNIKNIQCISPNSLNTYDMLSSDILLTTVAGIKMIEETYASS